MNDGLRAHTQVVRGEFRLDAELTVSPGEVVTLLGPNGAGKSTLLLALAGLVPIDGGRVELDGRVLSDATAGLSVPPQDRQVGVVWQDYLLFPHMSVLENVGFGLRARGAGRRAARERASALLQRFGLADRARQRPRDISGGEAQRVALARALIVEPRLLLLDEPMAALDAGTRPAVRAELRRHLSDYGGYTIVVTHDPLEAMVLGDRIVVLEAGRVVQDGTPAELARHPRTDYVAQLVGLNLLRGVAHEHIARPDGDQNVQVTLAHPADGDVFIAFAPTAVTVSRRRPVGSARNAWTGRVTDLERHGDLVRVRISGAVDVLADVTPISVADLDLSPGAEVWASVKASEINVYPR